MHVLFIIMKKLYFRDFPGGPVGKTLHFQGRGGGAYLIPDQGTKIPPAVRHGPPQKKKFKRSQMLS